MEFNFENLHQINGYKGYAGSNSLRYIAEIKHLGLGTFRVIKELNSYLLNIKVDEQFQKWDTQYAKIVEKNKQQSVKNTNINLAKDRTSDAQKLQKDIDDILLFTLDIDDTINWETLKDKRKFKIPNPKNELNDELSKLKSPYIQNFKTIPEEPLKANFQPKFSIIDKLFKALAEKKINQADIEFESAMAIWCKEKDEVENYNKKIEQENKESLIRFENKKNEIKKKYDILEYEWNQSKSDFYEAQKETNWEVEEFKAKYFERNPESVVQYCELVLNNSLYPDFLQKEFELDYNNNSKLLLVEYVLPNPESYPTLTEVNYITTKNEFKEYHLSTTQIAKLYDTLIYNITLRTLHELFEADQANAIEIIVLNGWVQAINKATGKKENYCIISIQVKKDEFTEIDLSQIDPKACFKNLKGIGSSKLSGITAIQPIIQINKNDKRFVSSYDVSINLDERSNLAAMDWEDFEHLIREIFEKEFSSNGGEVKVTQASRDGGVDAVAFDPDPIRGGKIVIQAKRYTNTVGVSAVRDLYGTVVNEGANKGILVTTADYGPDAYEFAKNKPLALINGSNLLYLLEKYGHKAKIDIAEAKRLQKENQ